MSAEQSTSTALPPGTGVDATAENTANTRKPTQPQRPNPREIYKLPAPIRTFPLPAFNPSSPLSLLHLAYAWVKQILFSPPEEPSVLHQGIWSSDAAAVIVTDPASIRAFWEQGFFGKGHLSRSEPNWLRGEQVRLGLAEEHVSEIATAKRREERSTMKWERAKAELEALRKTQLEEAQKAVEKAAVESVVADAVNPEVEDVPSQDAPLSSCRPSTLLASDDSFPVALVEKVEEKIKEDWTCMMSGALPVPVEHAEIEQAIVKEIGATTGSSSPVGPLELLALPNSHSKAVETNTQSSPAGSTTMAAAMPKKTNNPAQDELLDIPQSQESGSSSPVGPLELLALPNSVLAAPRIAKVPAVVGPLDTAIVPGISSPEVQLSAPIGPLELLALPNSSNRPATEDLSPPAESLAPPTIHSTPPSESTLEDVSEPGSPTRDAYEARPVVQPTANKAMPNGSLASPVSEPSKAVVDDAFPTPKSPLKHSGTSGPPHPVSPPKSSRFSPEIKSAPFDFSNPPIPELANLNGKRQILAEPIAPLTPPPKRQKSHDAAAGAATTTSDNGPPADLEHLQLTREEAFFLSFSLGVLTVLDPETKKPIPTMKLLDLFRRYSYMPPKEGPSAEVLRPDDKFLTNYVAYHHFRSLGWTPRPGIKFGVDLLLYTRGPVFDHAEYGVAVLPSYSDPAWTSVEGEGVGKKQAGEKSWDWFHRTTRTLSHAVKTIVLAYVDVPAPEKFQEALDKGGMAEALALYSVREVIVKRFNPNRNR